jgi:hypothetical protein
MHSPVSSTCRHFVILPLIMDSLRKEDTHECYWEVSRTPLTHIQISKGAPSFYYSGQVTTPWQPNDLVRSSGWPRSTRVVLWEASFQARDMGPLFVIGCVRRREYSPELQLASTIGTSSLVGSGVSKARFNQAYPRLIVANFWSPTVPFSDIGVLGSPAWDLSQRWGSLE